MRESYLICAAIKSREVSQTLQDHLEFDDISPLTRRILQGISDYYSKDKDCTNVNVELLTEQIGDSMANDKHRDQVNDAIQEAVGQDISAYNVADLVLGQKRRTLGLKLAETLINGDHDEDLWEQYSRVVESSSVEESLGNEFVDMEFSDLQGVLDDQQKIPVFPRSLCERIDGGLVRGDAVILAGRPEVGKSAFTITNMAGIAYHGHKVLYAGNEDAAQRIITRTISCLTGRAKPDILKDPEGTMQLARQRGYGNIVFAHPVSTVTHLKALIKKHKPDVVFLDQIRNMRVKADNRTGQLEAAAIAVRALAGEHDCAVISITQVGDSGEGKLHLTMSDIDSSKTGIPGACDIMILIGMDSNFDTANSRMINLPKNKTTGSHDSWAVKIDKQRSRYYDE